MNGDGYVGGEGIGGRIERATHIDFNGDNMIGRPLDTFPGGFAPQGFGGGFPPQGFGGPF